MNDLEEKEIQWDLNLSVLIHYLTSRTVCVPHSKQLSMPLLGAARLSPWTLVLPGRYKTFSTNKDFQKSRHLLPPTTSFSPFLSKTAHKSPRRRHRGGEGLPLGVWDLKVRGVSRHHLTASSWFNRNLHVESGRLLKACIFLRWRRTDGPSSLSVSAPNRPPQSVQHGVTWSFMVAAGLQWLFSSELEARTNPQQVCLFVS